MPNMGKRLKELRKKQGMTQTELAELLNTTKQNIYKYENDIVNIPLPRLKKIAEIFNCTLAYLIGYEEREYQHLSKLTDIINLCRSDDEISAVVHKVCKISPEQRKAVQALLDAFSVE